MMRSMTLCILTIMLYACTSNMEDKLDLSQEETVLRYLKEHEWPEAYANQDSVLLDRILDESFEMIDDSGNRYSKRSELDWIKENALDYDSFRYEIKRLEILPNRTAIVCGTGHIINDTIHSKYESSNVLIKKDGYWKAVLSHVSGLREI